MSFQFRSLSTREYAKKSSLQPKWIRFSPATIVKEFGAIDYIDFSPVEPHYFAVTCSVRVQVYNPITRQVVKNLSRFRDCAYGGSFRSDGRLIVAGGEENHVRLFDVQSKSLLRLFSGHSAPVHRTYFTQKQTNVASFSDDKTIAIWDIASEVKLTSFAEHEDYIRAGAVSPVSSEILLSGSYDGKVKMYDLRTGKSTFTVDHGSPVESTIFLPSGGIFLSCGGTDIKVWDAFTSGKLLASISQHHKAVTCLHLASHNKKLLSGSLDRHVKVYDLTTFRVIDTIDYPNAILSMAIPQNDETLAVGMVDGLISIRRKEENIVPKSDSEEISKQDSFPSYVDEIILEPKLNKTARYNEHIRKFQYSKALDVVLAPYITSKTPEITVTVMQELIRRNALHAALAGKEEKGLIAVLKFLIKHVGDVRFTNTLLKVINIFLDVYGNSVASFQPGVLRYFKILNENIGDEIQLVQEMASLEGMFSLLLSGSSTGNNQLDNWNDLPMYHIPSEKADKNFVINVS